MSDNFMKSFEKQMQPLKQLVEINNKAMEKLVQQQNAYMNDMLQASVEQASRMTTASDVQEFVKSQQAFIESMSARLMEAAQRNMAVMTEASEATARLLQDSVRNSNDGDD